MAAVIPYALMAVGTIMSANAQRQAGQQQNDMYRYQAAQEQASAERNAQLLERSAGDDRASSQRAADEKRRQSRYMQSRAIALAAASGAGALDPSVIDVVGKVGYEGDLAAQNELYQGESAATNKEYQAKVTRVTGANNATSLNYQGAVAKSAANTAATGTIISGASSLYGMYAKPSPSTGGGDGGYSGEIDRAGGMSTVPTKKWWE